ncbi:hypothetical protein P872_02390 [Rhodonellum psychrophilum GCM71 = DSM 17998]|uniref:VTT domain-containing protein n=2 Tax=Rhodonellum TaxID=336827 RepID=U5C417_9BACT|nr:MULTISPECIES: VTT domain-containing protein [Rhodonellum]ERM83666.1 hypothetical protein P872_02390 [Rhodonellum psychrophilum GCM71 = DSM 17998]
MKKNQGIFKGLQKIGKNNPLMVFAFIWVAIVPSLGSILLVPFFITNTTFFQQLDFSSPETWFLYLIPCAILMAFAFMPTTLLAGLTGFILGWKALLLLILSYTLATLFGYGLGKKMDKNSLDILLGEYPRAKALVENKKGKMGELIFFVRLSPIIPFAFSNLLFALLDTGWKRVVLFGFIGMLPRTLLAFGSGVLADSIYTAIRQGGNAFNWALIIGLILLSLWGIARFFKSK